MIDREKRRAEYLAKAAQAEEMAANAKTQQDREKWERIAQAYRGLAQTT
jgi:hypothetical protein